MATDNTVTLIGNLTDDPDLKFTPNGNAVANFRLAVTARTKDGDREACRPVCPLSRGHESPNRHDRHDRQEHARSADS